MPTTSHPFAEIRLGWVIESICMFQIANVVAMSDERELYARRKSLTITFPFWVIQSLKRVFSGPARKGDGVDAWLRWRAGE